MTIPKSEAIHWQPVKVAPEFKALIEATAKATRQPEYIVLDVLLKRGGIKSDYTSLDCIAIVNRAITKALARERL